MKKSSGDNVKERTCLKCGKKFKSKSVGNRICFTCDKTNERINTTASYSTTGEGGRVIRKPIGGEK